MAADKDRFGDKLRDVERGREDVYFQKRDRELLDRLRASEAADVEPELRKLAHMRCPKCGTALASHQLHAVSVEECPACHGIWLDKGELERIAEHERENHSAQDGWIARWLRLEFRKP